MTVLDTPNHGERMRQILVDHPRRAFVHT